MKTYKKKKETVTRRSLSNPLGTPYLCVAQSNKRRSFIQHWFTVVVIDTSGSLKPLWQYNPFPFAHLEVWYVAGTELAEYTNSVCCEHNRLLAEMLNASLKCSLVQVHMEYTIFFMCVVLYKYFLFLCKSITCILHLIWYSKSVQTIQHHLFTFVNMNHFCFDKRWTSLKISLVVNLKSSVPPTRRLCFRLCPFVGLLVCWLVCVQDYTKNCWKVFHETWREDGSDSRKDPLWCGSG